MSFYDASVAIITVVCRVINRAAGFLDSSGNIIAKPGQDASGNPVPLPFGETTAYVSLLSHPTTATRAAVFVDAVVLAAIQAAKADVNTDHATLTILNALPAAIAVLDNTWTPNGPN